MAGDRKICGTALAVVAFLSALNLAACDAKLETKIVHPTTMWTARISKNDFARIACFPFTCFSSMGNPDAAPPPAEILVGFHHVFDDGTWPCNCWEYVNYVYRGLVWFDPFKFPKNFVSATLMIQPTHHEHFDGTEASGEKGTIGGIYLASKNWQQGVNITVFTDENGTSTGSLKVSSFTPESNAYIVPFPENPGPKFPNNTTDFPVRKDGGKYVAEVSNQIKAWTKNSEPNHGFVFVGRNEALPGKTNQSWISRYKVWLEFTYNPANQ
jgi:hypothetical protein